MKTHKLAWLLATGVASFLVVACGGNDPNYGATAAVVPGFVPGAGIAPPRFAYVVHSNDASVSGYTVNATDGTLTTMSAGTPWATGLSPICIAVDPLVKYAYVANSGSDTLSIYSIADPTGVLTSAALPVSTGSQPKSVAVDPQGRYVFVANSGDNTVSAYTRSASTGLLTQVAGSPFAMPSLSADIAPWSVVVEPSGKFVYVANHGTTSSPSTISMFSIDTASTGSLVPGALTSLGSIAGGARPNLITVSPSGKQAYVSNETGDSVMVYDLNLTTGLLAYKGVVSMPGSTPTGVAIEPNNKYAYVSNRSNDTIGAYSIAQSGGSIGVMTFISSTTVTAPPLQTPPGPTSIAADPSGKFVYSTLLNGGGVAAYKITAGTGALTLVTGSPFNDLGAARSDFILVTK